MIKLNDDFSNLAEFEGAMNETLKQLWDEFQAEAIEGFEYSSLANWTNVFKAHGLTFEYYLDAEPYDFALENI